MTRKNQHATSLVKFTDGQTYIVHRPMETRIWVSFDKVGFHRYPDAPEEVKYLRELHRHIFKFEVCVTVHHDDRDIEFHMFKNWLTSLYEGQLNVDHKSCEMLAQELLVQVLSKYDCTHRDVTVDVSEDGECGASVFSPRGSLVPIGDKFIEATGMNVDGLMEPASKEKLEPGREQA